MSSEPITVIKVDTSVDQVPTVKTEPLASENLPQQGGFWGPLAPKPTPAPNASSTSSPQAQPTNAPTQHSFDTDSDDSDLFTDDEELPPSPQTHSNAVASAPPDAASTENKKPWSFFGGAPKEIDASTETTEDELEEDKQSTTSLRTVDLLAEDPLFLVLGQFFVSQKKENLADVMDKINTNLEKIIQLMSDK